MFAAKRYASGEAGFGIIYSELDQESMHEVAALEKLKKKSRLNTLNTIPVALMAGLGFPVSTACVLLGLLYCQSKFAAVFQTNILRRHYETDLTEIAPPILTDADVRMIDPYIRLSKHQLESRLNLYERARLFGFCVLSLGSVVSVNRFLSQGKGVATIEQSKPPGL